MARPRGEPTVTLSFRVPEDMAELVAVAAERAGESRNEWLRRAVEEALREAGI